MLAQDRTLGGTVFLVGSTNETRWEQFALGNGVDVFRVITNLGLTPGNEWQSLCLTFPYCTLVFLPVNLVFKGDNNVNRSFLTVYWICRSPDLRFRHIRYSLRRESSSSLIILAECKIRTDCRKEEHYERNNVYFSWHFTLLRS